MSILFDNPHPAIGCGDPGDPIDFGVFMDGNAHFSRNFASGGNRRKCTFHFSGKLVKTSDSTDRVLFNSPQPTTGTNGLSIRIETDRIIIIVDDGSSYWVGKSASLLRDFAGWYSATVTIDTDEPDPENRFILDVDGVRKSLETTAGSIPAQGSNLYLVSGEYSVGRRPTAGFTSKFFGYLAKFIYVAGIAQPSSAFRYTSLFGHPVNKRYTGAFGANGFHLDFADPLDFGKDVSGNGNHFTATGLTVDNQVTDTPTNNKSSLTPFVNVWGTKPTLSQGNRRATFGSGAYGYALADMPVSSGRWHFQAEVISATSSADTHFGLSAASDPNGIFIHLRGASLYQDILVSDGRSIPTSKVLAAGDKVRVIFDLDTGEFWVAVNDVFLINEPTESGISLPANMTGFVLPHIGQHSSTTGASLTVDYSNLATDQGSGTRSLTASARPCPEILNPDKYITQRVLSEAGQDVIDVPWDVSVHKTLITSFRLDAGDIRVTDTVRGVGKSWQPNTTDAEITDDGITAFTPNGYLVGSAAAWQGVRLDRIERASPKAGLDILLVEHVTGSPTTVPHLVGGIIDRADVVPLAGGGRRVYYRALAAGRYLLLNDPGTGGTDAGWFTSTANTLTIGASMPSGTYTVVARRSVPQFSMHGLYTGVGGTDGAFVPTDFLPRIFENKCYSAASTNFTIWDTDRQTGNPVTNTLTYNLASGEGPGGNDVDLNSNGAKFRQASPSFNTLNAQHVFSAYALTPGKFARAR